MGVPALGFGLPGLGGVRTRRGGAHLWKTTASTVMAASRRKAKAPRMDPITRDSLSGSCVDSSPGEPAVQDHRWSRPQVGTHQQSPARALLPTLSLSSLLTASGLEGPQASPHHPSCPPPRLSRLPLTLRQRLEIDLAPEGAVARRSPRPDLEAIDVAGA